MKLLIVSELGHYTPNSITDVKTRSDLLTVSLYQHFNSVGVNVVVKPPPTCLVNLTDVNLSRLDYPFVDNTLVVIEKAFKLYGKQFLSYVDNQTSQLVTSLCLSTKSSAGEDILFNMTPGLKLNNTEYVGYAIDHNIHKPKQSYDNIKIGLFTNDNQLLQQCLEFTVLNNVTLYLKVDCGFHIYKSDKTCYETVNITNYGELVDLYNTFNMCIVNMFISDLVTLAMSNVLLLYRVSAPTIPNKMIKMLDVIEFTEVIPWRTVFNSMFKVNTRDKLINMKFTLKDAADKILQKLLSVNKNRQIIDAFTNPRSYPKFDQPFEQYVREKYKPVTVDMSVFKQNVKEEQVEEVKEQLTTLKQPTILLQSQIKNYKKSSIML